MSHFLHFHRHVCDVHACVYCGVQVFTFDKCPVRVAWPSAGRPSAESGNWRKTPPSPCSQTEAWPFSLSHTLAFMNTHTHKSYCCTDWSDKRLEINILNLERSMCSLTTPCPGKGWIHMLPGTTQWSWDQGEGSGNVLKLHKTDHQKSPSTHWCHHIQHKSGVLLTDGFYTILSTRWRCCALWFACVVCICFDEGVFNFVACSFSLCMFS